MDQNKKPLTRMRQGMKRKRKRQKSGSVAAAIIGSCIAILFLVWLLVSFQALTTDHSNSKSSEASLLRNNNNLLGIEKVHGTVQKIPEPYQSPMLIFTCARANYLTETLETMYKYIPQTCVMGCPIVVSQDRNIPDVTQVIESFKAKFEAKGIPFFHIVHPQTPNLRGNAYNLLAVHYGWALRTLFDGKAYNQYPLPERVIILEEDLRIAPDFFDYFEATAPLLDKDPNLLAISAFNDNGYQQQVADTKRLLRSDFFPGLGWMMTRNTWVNDIGIKWPNGYWDDWLREPQQRRGRQFIRPEVTRTFHFGEKGGVSANQFGNNLNRVMLNNDPVDWKSEDVSYLEADTFDKKYARLVANAKFANSQAEALEQIKQGNDARLEYVGIEGFARIARQLHLMTDEKAGIFRTSYKGVVETRPNGGSHLFLTPPLEELKAKFGSNWPNR